MSVLMSRVKEFNPDMPSEMEDFELLWTDEEFSDELMEAISENFVLEVESSRMLAQREIKAG